MRLKKIKIAGFKSFVDPTTVHFNTALTGIVGPNGCGKSNTIDAVRWVMGESSAKHLRGGSMTDVIFNGSSSRKPVGKATVELIFDNTDSGLGGQYAMFSEISIRREVSRDGASLYFLNGSRCRRRDITDIFLGTGLGPRSYAIIEQGTISRMIEAKPDEMRVYLEEAAGISKYKERRRETQNRIKHTRENLERLDDLRAELNNQLRRLDRQAQTAERYTELKQQERGAKAAVLGLRLREQLQELDAKKLMVQASQTEFDGVGAELTEREAALETIRQQHYEDGDSLNEVQARFYNIGSEVTRLEQAIKHQKEMMVRAVSERDRVYGELNSQQEQLARNTHELTDIKARLGEIQPRKQEQEGQLEALAEAAETAQGDLLAAQQRWDSWSEQSGEARQHAEVEKTRIEHMEQALKQRLDRLSQLSEHDDAAQIAQLEDELESLAEQEIELTHTAAGAEEALNAALQELEQLKAGETSQNERLADMRNQNAQLSGRRASLEALQQSALGQQAAKLDRWLQDNQLDSGARIAEVLDVATGWEDAVEAVLSVMLDAVCVTDLSAVATLPQGLALALVDEHTVNVPTLSDSLLHKVATVGPAGALLAAARTANNLEAALAQRGSLAAHEFFVTPEATLVGPNWLKTIDTEDAQAGVLAREQALRELTAQLETAEVQLVQQQAQLQDVREQLEQQEQRRRQAQEAVNRTSREQSELNSAIANRRSRLQQLIERKQDVAREKQELDQKVDVEQSGIKDARYRLETAIDVMRKHSDERQQIEQQRDQCRQHMDQLQAKQREIRETAHQLELQVQSLSGRGDFLERDQARIQAQSEGLQQRVNELDSQLVQGDVPVEELQAKLQESLIMRVAVEEQLAACRDGLQAVENKMRALDAERQTFTLQQNSIRERLNQQKLQAQESEVRQQTLREQLQDVGLHPENVLAELTADETPQQREAELAQIRNRIERLGPINLAAIDELKEANERKDYLDKQYQDLVDALETLEKAIHKIDKETRERFRATFDKVNQGLGEMFPRLFGGGNAELQLTGDDLLDTGIAVIARPPGKRNSHINLLSGGEKALTAVALVFAIFQLNPAPFCMLDEVDAPLDDANCGRFADLVEAMSKKVQFIMITHNKISMERAQQLSGVTMREAGVSRLVTVDIDEATAMVAT